MRPCKHCWLRAGLNASSPAQPFRPCGCQLGFVAAAACTLCEINPRAMEQDCCRGLGFLQLPGPLVQLPCQASCQQQRLRLCCTTRPGNSTRHADRCRQRSRSGRPADGLPIWPATWLDQLPCSRSSLGAWSLGALDGGLIARCGCVDWHDVPAAGGRLVDECMGCSVAPAGRGVRLRSVAGEAWVILSSSCETFVG